MMKKRVKSHNKPEMSTGSDLQIEGVGNLLTHIARCCQPLPGDEVIGYTPWAAVSRFIARIVPIFCIPVKKSANASCKSAGAALRATTMWLIYSKAFDRPNLLRT